VKNLLTASPKLQEYQIGKLDNVKAGRDSKAVDRTLSALREAASAESSKLMPFILEAVKVYATLGEICGVFRDVFGEYRESVVL
jgi:methylmalonyl-CoA mutase N-terminal domain/subunit